MTNTEIEFKYYASMNLSKFKEFCEKRYPLEHLTASGFDHFYSHPSDSTSFYRHRSNEDFNQLTFKRKKEKDNNFIREEHNIDLDLSVSEDKVRDLCGISGYVYNTTIFKNCFIYNYHYYTLVYYICYNSELKELDRFIEIEMKEDYDWISEQEAFNELVTLERLFKVVGISPEDRVTKSLFEMYKKELK